MMIGEAKIQEVKDAADIVEVVGDYVRLKKSGSNFVGLCPYHSEKTPSFTVNPSLGIFKCFGCGESGDVIKFVQDQDGVSFVEATRQLAERYGVFIPEEEDPRPTEETQQKEGVYHALKFAGVYYYRNLIENPDARSAIEYLEKRGYPPEVWKTYGLGYAPRGGSDLVQTAQNAGIDTDYLVQADLIKPSQRNDGYYDTFRGRLMFPIFNPTGKVIGFAGRILTNEKTAKYINSAQTMVYNKSEVVYGVNFARNEIRKHKEVILVEGYTDVITLAEHGIKNVVASSGTALTSGQMKVLHRYGEKIVMIYDSDSAGQNAMKRGINIALAEGMDVALLELPEGEDPDSFVKQFGKESFLELKKESAKNFVDFLIMKAEEEGRLSQPTERPKVLNDVLEAIAEIKDAINRQVFVQHLHQRTQQFRGGTDKELFEQLERIIRAKRQQDERSRQREEVRAERTAAREQESRQMPPQMEEIPLPGEEWMPLSEDMADVEAVAEPSSQKKPHYEKELIRLLITYGRDMVEYVCSLINRRVFEDEELAMFFDSIVERFQQNQEVSIQVYAALPDPFPRLVGDVTMEQFAPSDRHSEKIGLKHQKDKFPEKTAKSTIKALELNFYERKRQELALKFRQAVSDEEKRAIIQKQNTVQMFINERVTADSEDLYPDPIWKQKAGGKNAFQYTPRSLRNP
ncbi:MAG: DNA primase [Bacteroidota bacterium]